MKVNWFKSEARDVRPFFDVESLGPALDHAAICLNGKMAYSEDVSFILSEQDLARMQITVRPGLEEALIRECPHAVRDRLSLAVRATNPFLKRTRVVERHAIRSSPPEIAIGPEVVEELGGGANLDIDVFLCLDGELPKKVGRPFFPGHWLAKKGFRVRSARIAEDFDVEPLDDGGWKLRGFPEKTLYLVNYIGPINEKPTPQQQIAKVFIHADVYRRMAAETDAKNVRAIQSLLAAEIVCQILAASLPEWESASEPEPHSPLSAVLKKINKTHKCGLSELRALAKEVGLQKLRAILQADQDTVRAIVEG